MEIMCECSSSRAEVEYEEIEMPEWIRARHGEIAEWWWASLPYSRKIKAAETLRAIDITRCSSSIDGGAGGLVLSVSFNTDFEINQIGGTIA